jgi:hypothetical protein
MLRTASHKSATVSRCTMLRCWDEGARAHTQMLHACSQWPPHALSNHLTTLCTSLPQLQPAHILWNVVDVWAFTSQRSEKNRRAVRRDFGDMRGLVLKPNNFTCVRKNLPTPFLSLSPDPVSMCPEASLGRYFSCRSSSCIIMASLWRQRTGDYICYIVLFVSPSALAEPLLFFLCHLLSTSEC